MKYQAVWPDASKLKDPQDQQFMKDLEIMLSNSLNQIFNDIRSVEAKLLALSGQVL